MDWAAELSEAAGPLLPAAQRFVAEHPGAPRPALPGADGLAALADAIDAWAEADVDESADESFVEGAGALLAIVLLRHVGEGGHLQRAADHRLRLGADGFVDPFAAVERALESDDARAALIVEVRRAEAEAKGEAGVGRAMRVLRDELVRARPELAIEEAFGPSVHLSAGIELDLTSVLRATDEEPDAAAAKAIAKLVSMLPGGAGSRVAPWEEVAVRLLPRPVAPGFADKLAAEGRGRLASRSWLGGALELTLILGFEDRSRYVREDELDAWGKSFDEALAHAVGVLAKRSERARFARVDTTAGALVVARTGDGLDAARLLLPTLHDVLAAELGSPLWVAAPHRDALWACAKEPALADALATRVQEDARRAPHAISERLFALDANGPRVVDPAHEV